MKTFLVLMDVDSTEGEPTPLNVKAMLSFHLTGIDYHTVQVKEVKEITGSPEKPKFEPGSVSHQMLVKAVISHLEKNDTDSKDTIYAHMMGKFGEVDKVLFEKAWKTVRNMARGLE